MLYRILSPTVVRQVLMDPQETTFESKNSPVYTLAMKGMIISLSGFKDKHEKVWYSVKPKFTAYIRKFQC